MSSKSGHRASTLPIGITAVIGLVITLLLIVTAIATGAVSIPGADILAALSGTGDETTRTIIVDLRAPRALLAALVGAGLAVSGSALQGTLRNVLAEPYLLGVSGGAALGAVGALALGMDVRVVTLAAFVGAATAASIVLVLAHLYGGARSGILLMAGVVVGAFANAAIMVALADAPPDRIRGALWWMMGSASAADWHSVAWLAGAIALLGGLLFLDARNLDLMALGEEPAAALGVNAERTGRRVFLIASWLAASTVAAVGLIGFVGLIVPNLARALGARRHRGMMVLSAIFGAALLVGADIVARVARPPAELPLGAVTALVGVPFFLAKMRSLR